MPDYKNQRPKKQPPMVPIRALRIALGMTQEEVCEKVTVITDETYTKGALSGLELGHRGVSAKTLAALEVVYKMPAGSLVTNYEPSHGRRKVEGSAA